MSAERWHARRGADKHLHTVPLLPLEATTRPSLPTSAQVYVWGRRHQYVNLSFLGIFTFTAPYLPWVLLAFSGWQAG